MRLQGLARFQATFQPLKPLYIRTFGVSVTYHNFLLLKEVKVLLGDRMSDGCSGDVPDALSREKETPVTRKLQSLASYQERQ